MLEHSSTVAPLVGLFGDFLTFGGGLILAVDAVYQEKQFKKVRKIAAMLRSPELARLKVEVKGIVISDESDVEHAFVRQSSRRALIGTAFLVFGFSVLLAARLMEICSIN